MTRLGGVRGRILIASALSAALGVAVTFAVFRAGSRALVLDAARTALPRLMERGIVGECEADPARFALAGPGPASTWAYGGDLTPTNPAAPALDAVDRARAAKLGAGEFDAHMHSVFGGGVVVARVAAGGPCQVIGSFFSAPPYVQRLFEGVALLGLLVSAAGALAAWLVVVRPLVRRIAALRRAAGLVGSEEGYAPPPEGSGSPDDLDELGRALDRAHRRIVADAAALREKRHELRRHVENIAHDLKTPLSSLQLILEQAADEATPGAPLSDLVTAAIRDTVYLGGLTANLRLAAVLEDGFTPRKQPGAPLLEIVERATSRVGLLASRRGVDLAVALPDEPIAVDADPLAAEQAISNVVENAVVHGAEGGHVSVLVRAEGPDFEILVMDDGPGVVADDLPRLGERTFRADRARRRDGRGQGLGLAITREVCRCFEWTITFARMEPEGLRVSLRGPRSTLGGPPGTNGVAGVRPVL